MTPLTGRTSEYKALMTHMTATYSEAFCIHFASKRMVWPYWLSLIHLILQHACGEILVDCSMLNVLDSTGSMSACPRHMIQHLAKCSHDL